MDPPRPAARTLGGPGSDCRRRGSKRAFDKGVFVDRGPNAGGQRRRRQGQRKSTVFLSADVAGSQRRYVKAQRKEPKEPKKKLPRARKKEPISEEVITKYLPLVRYVAE